MHAESERAQRVEHLISARRSRLERLVQARLSTPRGPEVPPDRLEHLLAQARDLYWNELSWEQLTAEEARAGRRLVEFMFPGFLALVDGLLLRETAPDSVAPATPRPAVVEEILRFLAGRRIELQERPDPESALELAVVERLIDLVLYRLHDVPVEGVERLESDDEAEG